ncbi:MAG: relaxase/mobilization nuclease domain-containing protein [Lentisphaerae bacterium]|nr:relaxase/mobilization nuclease domain-containing protein [Lentisphaerota bacterium]
MKAHVNRGSGFRGVLDYALRKDKNAEIIGGNMVGETSRALAAEFKASRELRPECERPVWHCSLSLPKNEKAGDERWSSIAEKHLKNMDIDPDKHQYVVIQHKDTEYDHIHIIASRIGLDGEIWKGQWEARKAIQSTQKLEKEFGLSQTKGLEEKRTEKRLTSNEINMAARTKKAPTRAILQNHIAEALEDKPTTAVFLERMAISNIGVRPNIASTGRMSGISFELEGIKFKGSQLGKGYSWAGLQKKGLDYEQDRDREVLNRAKDQTNYRADGGVEKATKGNNPGICDTDRAYGAINGSISRRSSIEDGRDKRTQQGDASRKFETGKAMEPGTKRGGKGVGEVSARDNRCEKRDNVCKNRHISNGEQVANVALSSDHRGFSWGSSAQRIRDLAEPVLSNTEKGKEMGPNGGKIKGFIDVRQGDRHEEDGVVFGKRIDRTRLAVQRQLKAMGCKVYEIGIRDQETGKMMNRELTLEQVENSVAWLKRMNAKGSDIYIRPAKNETHGLVLVDDVDGIKLEEMKANGHNACCIVETSPENHQAWVKLSSQKGLSDAQRTDIAKNLAQIYDADRNSADHRHYGRLAGFTNRKSEHENRYGQQPYCLLRNHSGVIALNASKLTYESGTKLKEQEKQRRIQAIKTYEPTSRWHKSAVDEYKSEMKRLYNRYGNKIDWSKADWMVCKDMACKRYDADEIKKTMEEASPNLFDRKKGHVQDYVKRTVDKVMKNKDVQKALQPRGFELER